MTDNEPVERKHKLIWSDSIRIGYLTDGGKIILARFEVFMKEMGEIDRDLFREHYADLQQLETKYVCKTKSYTEIVWIWNNLHFLSTG